MGMVFFFSTAPWTKSSSSKTTDFSTMNSMVATSQWVLFPVVLDLCHFASPSKSQTQRV
jgi:hypothetical protein